MNEYTAYVRVIQEIYMTFEASCGEEALEIAMTKYDGYLVQHEEAEVLWCEEQ